MNNPLRYDQQGRLLSDTEFIQRVAEAVAANVIAHYECGFTKDDIKVGVTPEGCIVSTGKTYFETPILNKLTPEEYQRLGSVLAALLDTSPAPPRYEAEREAGSSLEHADPVLRADPAGFEL